VLPFQIQVTVTIFIAGVKMQVETIATQVSSQVEGIPGIDDMADVQIGIIKISLTVLIRIVRYDFKNR
jgi:hypothetical protein